MMTLDTLKGLDVASLMRDATGRPLALPVDKIEPDPDNIRTKIDPEALKALAETIQSEGLIQPISVRPHPKKKGHYLINAGERRWRAVKLLGRETIDAYVREPFDPYVQAIENLQREDLSALDLAQWVAKREADGESRATIARKLGKPASFITEAATLARAPTPIVAAFDSGQIPDTRTAYLLANAWDKHGATVRALLASDAPLTRAGVVSALAAPASPTPAAATERATGREGPEAPARSAKPASVLGVDVSGRKGRLVLKPGRTRTSAEVVFEDGSREQIELGKIRLTRWMQR